VKESPVQFECKVRDIIETGNQGGAGNLVICEILLIHINEAILDDNGNIDPHKIDLVGRLGGDYYCRASGDAVFMVKKPLQKLGIGIDRLPDKIRQSEYLTGNELGKLGNIESLPNHEDIESFIEQPEYASGYHLNTHEKEKLVIDRARKLMLENKVLDALKLMMGFLD